MKLTVERKPASLVVLDITAEDHEFADAMTKAVRKVSRDIQVPGFRKGKAPRAIIERQYGREVFLREAADEVMERLYRDAIQQEDITPVGEPSVEINELEPVNFVVTVPVYPEIDPGEYTSVRVDPVDATVTDADVDEVIERLQKNQSPWVEVTDRAPVDGDQVTVDYTVELDGEPFQEPVADAVFVLGETNLLVQLKDKLHEMNVDETASFDLAFDEDDETADPTIRGKSLSYTVTTKAIKQRAIMPIDDEFAKQVADAESVDDLRRQIREDIHQGKTTDARTSVVNDIINAMAEGATIDPPAVMVDEEVGHQLNHFKENLSRSQTPYESYLRLQDKTEDDVRADLRPEAERRLRNSLLLQAIARKESVEVSDEDIEAEIDLVAPTTGAETPEQEAQAARMREFYRSDYFRNMLRNELYERKLTDRLVEIATEGRGAVTGGWVAPDPVAIETDADGNEVIEARASVATGEAADSSADEEDAGETTSASSSKLPDSGEGTDWVAGDGTDTIPDGFPLKGNASSKIYHPVESSSYGRTVAEIYFATPDAAEAAGYRLPKSLQTAGETAGTGAGDVAEAAADAAAKSDD